MRRLTGDDLPWLRELFAVRFAGYDAEATEAWFTGAVLPNPVNFLAVRTDGAFLLAFLRPTPWRPCDLECRIITVCAEPGHVWQALPLLRHSVEWARSRKAVVWQCESDTLHEIGPLVRRLGAVEIEPRFRITLGN